MNLFEVRFNHPDEEPNPIRVVLDSEDVVEAIAAGRSEWEAQGGEKEIRRVSSKLIGKVAVSNGPA